MHFLLLLRFEQKQIEKSFDSQSLYVLRTGETDNLQGWCRNINPALILFPLFSIIREIFF